MEVNTPDGKKTVDKREIDCYRGTSEGLYNAIIFFKKGGYVLTIETFDELDAVLDISQ